MEKDKQTEFLKWTEKIETSKRTWTKSIGNKGL